MRTNKFKSNNAVSASFGKHTVISVAVALAVAGSLTANVEAAGLGRLSVQSALGQPLRAEVEVTALGKDESGNLVAKLASPEAFKQAGLEFSAALNTLRFVIEKRADGRSFVKITSTQPINEPFVDLMVELTWPTGRFVREYTFLLDPADLKFGGQTVAGGDVRTETVVPPAPLSAAPLSLPQAPNAAPVVPIAPAQPVAPAQTASLPPVAPAKPSPAATKVTTTAPEAAAVGSVNVKPGDTLAVIAGKNKAATVSLDQAIVAIYRANPSAFFGDVNKLKSGAALSIPDQAAMEAVPVAEARQQVRVRSTNFASYKSRVASAAKAAPSAGTTGRSAAGAIGAQVEDGAPKAAGADQVRLSKGAAQTAAAGKSALGSGAGKEAKFANQAALNEANARVKQLEDNVAKLNDLVKLKDKQLADLQSKAEAAAKAGKGAEGTIGKSGPTVPTLPQVAKVEPPKVDAPKAAASPSVVPPLNVPKVDAPKVNVPKLDVPKVDAPKASDTLPAIKPPGASTDPLEAKFGTPKTDAPKVDVPKLDVPKVDAPKAETPAVPPKVDAPKPVVPAPIVAAKPVPAPLPVEKSMLQTVQDDYPFALPGLGALALIGAGYGLYSMRRRKKAEKFEDSLMEGEAFSANSLFGSTGGQNVDTSVSTSSQATRTETGVEVGSTEVDPIAEAEVYIAYGREGQAEEILKEALRKQGDRQAIRLKLLEIYAGRKDTAAFEATAREMHAQTRGKNEEWPKVVTLGLSIDPNNSLYTGADSGGAKSGTAKAAGFGVGAAGSAAIGTFGSGMSAAKEKAGEVVDSLQAASQIVPPIPDFMNDTASSTSAAEPSVFSNNQEASIDFDFGAKNTITKAAAKLNETGSTAAKPIAASFDSMSLPSLDLPSKTASKPAAMADAGMDFSIDLPSLEALTGNGEVGGNTLDFGTTTAAISPANTQTAAWQEMATKLDLAAAYEEIGDKDGARELLDEVAKGGDAAQKQKAKSMLSKLG